MPRPFLLLALALSACALATDSPRKVKPAEAATLIAEQKVQLLDVRTEDEWNEGHLEGATRIEIGTKDFAEKVKAGFDQTKPLLVYCRSARRSARAAAELKGMGFPTLYDLDGGIRAWTNAGHEVVK